jgi:predicted MFS family arabinose efflux permease
MKIAVPLLAAAAFAMLTNEFNIIGVLPLIAHDLGVPVAQVGLLVSAFAFTVAITGPFLTLALRRVERRLLFTSVLGITALGAGVATIAPNYAVLACGRVLSALALPVYWSMATSTAARIAGPANAGRAMATVFSGVAVASVAGSPITTILADMFGWRLAFAAGGILCALIAVIMWIFFPRMTAVADNEPTPPLKVLTYPLVLVNLLMSFLALTAMFTSYTYLADLLTRIGHFSVTLTGWILMGFGAAGIVGNAIAGRFVDVGPRRASMVAILIGTLGMGLFPSTLKSHSVALGILAFWGGAHAAGFVTNHVRATGSAPASLQDLAASLNVSIFNAGIGMGAVVGGRVIEAKGLQAIGVAGAVIGAAALGVAALIPSLCKRYGTAQAFAPNRPDRAGSLGCGL